MNRNQFLILAAIMLVLVAAGAGVFYFQRGEWRTVDTRVGQRLVPGLVISDVAEIRIVESGSVVTVEKKEGLWTVKERAGYQGNVDRIAEFLNKLTDLKTAQVEPLADSHRARLGLVEPKEGVKDAGTLVEIKDKGGKTTRLLLGKQVVRQSATTAPGKASPGASGRYVAPPEPGVFAVVSDSLSLAEAKPALWLYRDIVRVVQASRISSVGPGGKVRWSASRPNESADWKSDSAEQRVDNNKVQDLVSALIYVPLTDIAPDASQAGFEDGVTLKIDTFNNYHYTLTFGRQDGDLRYMKVALEADPPKARPPQKGESAEDKKSRDEQYAKDHDGMLAHVQREKKTEGWTYLVKNEDIQALLRDRGQMQPDRKDDKKGEKKK
jgi:hypothetical protein